MSTEHQVLEAIHEMDFDPANPVLVVARQSDFLAVIQHVRSAAEKLDYTVVSVKESTGSALIELKDNESSMVRLITVVEKATPVTGVNASSMHYIDSAPRYQAQPERKKPAPPKARKNK